MTQKLELAKEFSLLRRQNLHKEAADAFMRFVKANYKPEKEQFSEKERAVVLITIVTWLWQDHGIQGDVLNGIENVFDYWVREIYLPLEKPKPPKSGVFQGLLDQSPSLGGKTTNQINQAHMLARKNTAAIAGYLIITKIGDYLLGPLFPPPDEKLKERLLKKTPHRKNTNP